MNLNKYILLILLCSSSILLGLKRQLEITDKSIENGSKRTKSELQYLLKIRELPKIQYLLNMHELPQELNLEIFDKVLISMILEAKTYFDLEKILNLLTINKLAQNIIVKFINKYDNEKLTQGNTKLKVHVEVFKIIAKNFRRILNSRLEESTAKNSEIGESQDSESEEIELYEVGNLVGLPNLRNLEKDIEFCLTIFDDVNKKDSDGFSALMIASIYGHKNLAELLLNLNSALELTNDQDGKKTALMYAAKFNQVHLVALLLRHQAKVNAIDDYSCTPLWHNMLNQKKYNFQVCQSLIKAGANVNHTVEGDTFADLILIAAYDCDLRLVKLLLQYNAITQENIILRNAAIIRNDIEMLKLFISKNIPIESNGITKTIIKVIKVANEIPQESYVNMLKFIIENGSDSNTVHFKNKYTALELAIKYDLIGLVKVLLENGAQLTNQEKCLKLAIKNKNKELVDLINKKIDEMISGFLNI